MYNDYKSCKVGIEGEEKINKTLSIHTNIINLSNIRLEVLDDNNQIHSIENDNILLTKNGIFVLEVKNFGQIGNYDIIIEKDGRWLRRNRYNKETSLLKNVTRQNNRHIGFLNKFINESTNRSFDDYIEVDGIIVIANEKVTIENYNENQNIFRDSELYSYIISRPTKFKKEELDKIKKVILENNLPAKKYIVYDYYLEMLENIKNLEQFYKKYDEAVNTIINLGLHYDNETKNYKYKLENDNFYCKKCHNRVLPYEDKCNNCNSIDTINKEELDLIKLKQERIQKKNRAKRLILYTFFIILTIIGIKINGERIIKVDDFSEGLARVQTRSGLYGFINESNELVIKPKYKSASYFSEGLAAVSIKKGVSAYIDKSGDIVIGPMKGYGGSFNDGLAWFSLSEKECGFINTSGKFVIKPTFSELDIEYEFSDGLVSACFDGLWGYLDTNGKIAIKPQFAYAGNFSNGTAEVTKHISEDGYTSAICKINKSGEIIKTVQRFKH